MERSSIALFDDDGILRFKAWRELSDAYRVAVDLLAPRRREEVSPQRVMVEDVRADGSLAQMAGAMESEGIRAMAFVPLSVAGRLLGSFTLYYPEPHRFTRREVSSAQIIAASVAFAIDQQEKREHLEAMIASPAVGIAELDPSGKFRDVNQRFCELTGRSAAELVGKLTCYDITHPDDHEEARGWFDRLTRGESHFVLDERYVRPDGSQVYVSKSVSAIRDSRGTYKGTIAFVSDITQRKLMEQSLRISEQRYRELIGALDLAVYTTDAEGRITLYNEKAAQAWGRRPEIGVDSWCGGWRIFTPEGEPVPPDQCPMAVALRERRPVRAVEIVIERPDGQRFTVLPHPTPMYDEDGRLIGAVNVLIDVTDRKRAETELKQAYALKDQFLSLVSHELRTPISTILGNGILLSKRGHQLSEENKQQAYDDIVSQTRKLHESIENLLLLTRLDSATLELEAISLSQVARGAIEAFQGAYRDRKVILLEREVPNALGQETLVALVMQNLLTNAAKYSPPETDIELIIDVTSDNEPQVCVRDHGIGLNQEELANLFTPFYRSQKARESASGLGLGLAVCKRIVEVQNGRIEAVSRPEGGSDFYFCLPRATGG